MGWAHWRETFFAKDFIKFFSVLFYVPSSINVYVWLNGETCIMSNSATFTFLRINILLSAKKLRAGLIFLMDWVILSKKLL